MKTNLIEQIETRRSGLIAFMKSAPDNCPVHRDFKQRGKSKLKKHLLDHSYWCRSCTKVFLELDWITFPPDLIRDMQMVKLNSMKKHKLKHQSEHSSGR